MGSIEKFLNIDFTKARKENPFFCLLVENYYKIAVIYFFSGIDIFIRGNYVG
jgi:hypothetical protein